MAAKELPKDRVSLEHLLGGVDRLLEVVEPLCQQVKCVTEIAADFLEGDFTEIDFFGAVSRELAQNVARGIPARHVLFDYLDLDALVSPSQVSEQELERLNHLIGTGAANAIERERHTILASTRIAEYRVALSAYVDRLHNLQRRILEELTTHASASVGVTHQPSPVAPKGRKIREKGEARLFLMAALDSLIEEGRWGMSHSEIIKRACVSKDTFYRLKKHDSEFNSSLKKYTKESRGRGPVQPDAL